MNPVKRPVPEVYRAPMWSRDDAVDHGTAVRWALSRGVVGVGGRLAVPTGDLEEAATGLEDLDPALGRRLRRFAAVEISSFVWTRTPDDGRWWVGRIVGPWAYDAAVDAAAVDLPHTRACCWIDDPVPAAQVPERVLESFARGGRNFQRIHGGDVEGRTERLWAGV